MARPRKGAGPIMTQLHWAVLGPMLDVPGKVFTTYELVRLAYAGRSQPFSAESVIRVVISKLRVKFDEDIIHTIRDEGYQINPHKVLYLRNLQAKRQSP